MEYLRHRFTTSFRVADPGSGVIRCLFDPWIRDTGWIKKSISGSGMNNPDHISENLETIFGLEQSGSGIRDKHFRSAKLVLF
jgi:hypothetical protein